jgi:GNAT superfamily N-acetyltransferase
MRISTGPLTDVEAAHRISQVCGLHDQPDVPVPTLATFQTALANPHPGHEFERYLGCLDDVPVGYLSLGLPQHDNQATVNVELCVRPEHRRHGVGRALFQVAVDRAGALGRRHLIGPSVQTHPDGAAFATAMGARRGLEEVRSRLDLRTADQARFDALLAEAWTHAGGYSLIQWIGVPPDEVIDDAAYLDSRLIGDAPVGDLAWEPEQVDADQVRRTELNRIERGRAAYHSGVLAGSRMIAWTTIAGQVARPEQAWQLITLVDPEHRGHRLGLVVKLENLRHARANRPGLEVIDTFNAATNEHMLAINRRMGFRAMESLVQWQVTSG